MAGAQALQLGHRPTLLSSESAAIERAAQMAPDSHPARPAQGEPWSPRPLTGASRKVSGMVQNMQEWLAGYAAKIGTAPPTREELDVLLELAGVAAHASERPAAPITCWLVGRAGLDPRDALAAAQRLAGDSQGDVS